MEIVSPIDYAKQSVLAVQEYAQLAGRSVANVLGHPRYVSDTLHQADGLNSLGFRRHLMALIV